MRVAGSCGVGSHGGSGGGAASQLTSDNTNTSGAVLRFINEASGNAIRYIMFRGVNTSFSSLIVFGTNLLGDALRDILDPRQRS